LISEPAFRHAEAVEGLRARVDRRLVALAWSSLFVALATGAAWLIIVGSQMSGMPLGAVLQNGVLKIVLTQTRFGEDWLIRAALVIVLAGCLAVRSYNRRRVTDWIGLLAAAAFIASLAWAGHGAATEQVPFDVIHLPADILHLMATGAWLGGLLPLALVLSAVGRDGSPDEVAVARAATLRFSTIGLTSVGTLLVTGIVNTWFLAGSIPALLGTLYGQLLIVKVLLFSTMIAVASRNRRRFIPDLTAVASDAAIRLRAIRQLRGNVSIEASIGIFVLAIVGTMGILPPGLHTEPNWPLPFQVDLSEIAARVQPVLDVTAVAIVLCLVAVAVAAQRRRHRVLVASIVGLIVFSGIGLVALRPAIVRAYPTTYYASTQPYTAPSVARGAPLFSENCAVCHGAGGRGDGPMADKLPVRPADLTEPHLFAHKIGDIFWWVSYGSDNKVMPGFANKLNPDQRWDLINFVLARTAGDLTANAGSQVATTAAPPLPDFAFEQNGAQNTLSQTLKSGPVLIVLFAAHAPRARLEQLATLAPRLAAAGLHVVAVGLGPSADKAPLIGDVSDDVRAALALFRSAKDGGETELMLDRGASVRARWTASGAAGLADATTLLADAVRVAKIPVAAANHAGHAH
jgi:putative copper export protein/mono/diheme cytochrome c family protein